MKFFSTCRALFRGRLPGQAVIQITTRCNARCVQYIKKLRKKIDSADEDSLIRNVQGVGYKFVPK